MKLYSKDIVDGELIDQQFAFGRKHPTEHIELSHNRNPHLAWKELPEGTRMLVLLCVDPDVPSVADDVNQEHKFIDYSLPRVDFYHWVMVGIRPELAEINQGSCSDGVVANGKRQPEGPDGSRQGLNDYTGFMQGGPMEGRYYGYDGPCPPWNDERLHRYHFTLYALDVEQLQLEIEFDGRMVIEAMDGHILAKDTITGTYTLNPDVRV